MIEEYSGIVAHDLYHAKYIFIYNHIKHVVPHDSYHAKYTFLYNHSKQTILESGREVEKLSASLLLFYNYMHDRESQNLEILVNVINRGGVIKPIFISPLHVYNNYQNNG